MSADFVESDLGVLLPIYYSRLFPFKDFYRWLSYGNVNKKYFTHRELSFTLEDDIYIRYLSFANQEEMEKEILKKCPRKIDIGAVFSSMPKDHRQVSLFQALERELVFDIDMTDYDDARYCCSGADICIKCWPLMTMAVKILNKSLKDDFGFEHLLWVYSGRRGIHCWVCDEKARQLSADARGAIAQYLTVVKGGSSMSKRVKLWDRVHPCIQRATSIIEEHFVQYAVVGQDIFGDEKKRGNILALVPDDEMRMNLENRFQQLSNGVEMWEVIKKEAKLAHQKGSKKCTHLIEEIMLQFCYPRLDVNVTKGVNHLLKSPFCVHPKTGRVCIPFSADEVDKFDPFSAPIISDVIEEMNTFNNVKSEGSEEMETDVRKEKVVFDYKKTSLKDGIAVFKTFLKSLESTWSGKMLDASDKTMDF